MGNTYKSKYASLWEQADKEIEERKKSSSNPAYQSKYGSLWEQADRDIFLSSFNDRISTFTSKENEGKWWDKNRINEADSLIKGLDMYGKDLDQKSVAEIKNYLTTNKNYYSQWESEADYNSYTKNNDRKIKYDNMSLEDLRKEKDEYERIKGKVNFNKNSQVLATTGNPQSDAISKLILGIMDEKSQNKDEDIEKWYNEYKDNEFLYKDTNGIEYNYDNLISKKELEDIYRDTSKQSAYANAIEASEKLKESNEEYEMVLAALSSDNDVYVQDALTSKKKLLEGKIKQLESVVEDFNSLGYDFEKIRYYQTMAEDARTEPEKAEEAQKFANEHGVDATFKSMLTSPLMIGEYAKNLVDTAKYGYANIYDDKNINQNRIYNATVGQNIDDWVTDKTGQEWAGWLASTAYSGVTSAAQSAAVATVGTILSGGNVAVGTGAAMAIMGTQAAASSYNTAIRNGSTNGEAIAFSLASGIGEAMFEKLPLDNLFSLAKGAGKTATKEGMVTLIKGLAKQSAIEGLEEGGTELWNAMADAIISGDHSAYNIAVDKYIKQGYSEADAKKMATTDWLKEVASSVIGGAIGGGVTGGAVGIPSYTINQGIQNAQYKALGESTIQNQNVEDLVADAQSLVTEGEKNALNKLANKVAGVENVDNLSKRQTKKYTKNVGKLVDAVASAKLNSIEVAQTEAIKHELESNGVENVSQATDILVKKLKGQTLTKAETEIFEAVDGNTIIDSVKNLDVKSAIDKDNLKRTKESLQKTGELVYKENKSIQHKQMVKDSGYTTTEGKTTVDATGAEVDSMIIESLEGEDVSLMVKMGEDSAIVLAGELNLNDNYAVMIEGLKRIDKKFSLSTSSANKLLALYESYNGDAFTFYKAMEAGISYGHYNIREYFNNNEFVKDLPQEYQEKLYEIGRENVQKTAEEKQALVELEGTTKATGKVTFAEGVKYHKLNKHQKAQVDFAQVLAKTLGFDLEIFQSPKNAQGKSIGENGSYSAKANLMRLDIDAGTIDGKSLILFTQSHELTHYIQKWSPAKYKLFADFLMEKYAKSDVPVQQLIEQKIEESKISAAMDKSGKHHVLTESEAFDEIVANACEDFLADPNIQQTILEIAEVDQSLAQKIKNFIKNLVARIEKALRGLQGQSAEAQFVRELDMDAIQELKALWMEALKDARENVLEARERTVEEQQAIEEFGDDLGSVETNEDGDVTLITNQDNSTLMYSERTWLNGGKDALISALTRNEHTQEEINDIVAMVEDSLDYLKILAAGDAQMRGYKELADNLLADITTDIKGKKQVLHAIVNNGDYPVNIDLALICKKRVAYMNVMTRLIADGVMENVKYDGDAIAEVNAILRKNGFETACLGCFVESRRLQFQTWAETIVQEWNGEVDKRNKNAGSFNYTKNAFTDANSLTEEELNALEKELSGKKKNKQGNLNLGGGSVPTKMGKLLDSVPTLQKHISVADLLTPEGLTKLRAENPNLFSLIKQRYGSNTPKIVQKFNPYASELANLTFKSVSDITAKSISGSKEYLAEAKKELASSKPRLPKGMKASAFNKSKEMKDWNAKVETLAMRKYLYDIGGARMQSFSDFMIENVFDYMQIFADLAANKFPLHAYSKEVAFLRLFGMTGAKINGSLIAHVDKSFSKKYAGLLSAEEAKKGNAILVHTEDGDYAIGFDDYSRHMATKGKTFIQSIGMKDMIALQMDKRYSKNVGSITIGVSDVQILAMLDSPLFRYIIPYHSSGMLPEFAQLVGVDLYNDYTKYQNTTVKQYYDLNKNPLPDEVDDKGKTKLGTFKKADGKSINADTSYSFNAELQKIGDPKIVADNYVAWCNEFHEVYDGKTLVGYAKFNPKFSNSPYGTDFSKHENYYKLLEDFNLYDCITEQYATQGAVEMIFPSAETRLSAAEMEEYKQRLRDTGIFTEKEIEKYAKKADMTFEELLKAEVKNRIAYQDDQNPKWESTIKEIEDKLEGKYSRVDKPSGAYDYDWKKPYSLDWQHQDRDSTGRKLSPEQIEFFKDSKIRDEDGNLLVVYHGTNEEFTVFDKTKGRSSMDIQGSFFSPWDLDAQGYGQNVKAYYLNITNPASEGVAYKALNRFKGQNYAGIKAREYLESLGYDGVNNGDEEYIAFNSNQIKLVDNLNPTESDDIRYQDRVTPAEDAEYLELAQNPEANEARLREMVDEAANKMLSKSKLRTEDGKLRKVYHGTNTGEFTVFNSDYIGMSSGDSGFFGKGFYFAFSKGEALYYGANRIISAYLDLRNPFNYIEELLRYNGERASYGDAPNAVFAINIYDKFPDIVKDKKITAILEWGSYDKEAKTEELSYSEFSKIFKDIVENKKFNYTKHNGDYGVETIVTADEEIVEFEYEGKKHTYSDYGFQKTFLGDNPSILDVAYEYLVNKVYKGIELPKSTNFILDNNDVFTQTLKEMGYDGVVQSMDGDEAVVFKSSQIKSADLVTYDDSGNIIPLSERFNEGNEDIRYSEREFKHNYEGTQLSFDDIAETTETDIALSEFVEVVEGIHKTGKWTGKEIIGLFEKYPSFDFVGRMFDEEGTFVEQTMVDLVRMLSKIDDTKVLDDLSWFPIQARNGEYRKRYRAAINRYKKAIDARVNDIAREKTGATSLNIKTGKYSINDIEDMFYKLNTNDDIKLLADKVFARAKTMRLDIQFKSLGKVGATSERDASHGHNYGQKIKYNTNAFNSFEYTDQWKATVLLHELIHAETSWAIHRVNKPNIFRYSYDLTPEMRKAVETIKDVYAYIRFDTNFTGEYGITDEYEMIAELSNPKFRDKLEKKNLLHLIIDAIKDILGISKVKDNALDAAEKALEYIIENFDYESFKSYDMTLYRQYSDYYKKQRTGMGSDDIRYQDRPYKPSLEDLGIQRENEKLKADVENLKEMLKLQSTVTHGKVLAKAKYKDVAKKLLHDFGMKQVRDEELLNDFVKRLDEYFSGIINSDELTWEFVMEGAYDVAKWLERTMPDIRQYKHEYAEEFLKGLSKTKVTFTESQKVEAAYSVGGTFNQYRKMHFGKFKIVNEGGEKLTNLWGDLVSEFGGVIRDEYIQAGQVEENIPSVIVKAIDEMRETESIFHAEVYDMRIEWMADKIYDAYWLMPTVKTLADKHQLEVNLLKGKHREQMDALRETYKEREIKTKEDYKKHYAELAQKIREHKDAQLETYKEHVKEMKVNERERKSRTFMKNKIKGVVKKLNSILSKGSKEKNVKIPIQPAVAKALELAEFLFDDDLSAKFILTQANIDVREEEMKDVEKYRYWNNIREEHMKNMLSLIEQEGTESQVANLKDTISEIERKMGYLEKKLSSLITNEKKKLNQGGIGEAVKALAEAYSQLQNSQEDYVKEAYNEGVYNYIKGLADKLQGAKVKEMSADQMFDVYTAFKAVLTTVRQSNKLFINGRREDVQKISSSVMMEISSNKKTKTVPYEKLDALKSRMLQYSWNELKPYYAFQRLGSSTLMKLYEAARQGEDVLGRDYQEAITFAERVKQKYGYDSWDMNKRYDIKLEDGRTFTVSLQEVMSIYAYSKREQAYDHMMFGGFVFNNKRFFKKDKSEKQGIVDKLTNPKIVLDPSAEAYRLSMKNVYEIGKIIEQVDGLKEFVDEMQGYLSTDMAAKGNEISRVLYGVDWFREKNYFPIKSSHDFLAIVNNPVEKYSLRNSGMTKATVPHAHNPLVLEDFMSVWAEHVGKMSTYHALVIPIDNLNKVIGYKEASISARTVIDSVFGKINKEGIATTYLDNFLKDLNGGVSSQGAKSPIASMFGKFKKTAVAASSSVVVQQPTAILRAMAEIDGKYFVGASDKLKHNEKWELIKKYAPVAVIKELGGFDIGSGKRLETILTMPSYEGKDKVKGFFTDSTYRNESLDNAFMWGATEADKIGWNIIWSAVEREIKDTTSLKNGTEEFYKKVGERFTEVVHKTQVYDSTFTRSGFQRSKSDLVQMSMSFMGEPTTTFNMLYDAILQLSRKKISKGQACKIVGAVTSSIIMAAVMKSFIYALRDDDEDESYVEKYTESLTESLTSDLFVPNMLPFVKDITSILNGWSVERTDFAIFTDIYKSFEQLSSDNVSDYRKVEDLIGSLASLFGIPAKNLLRTGREMYNMVKNVADDNLPYGQGVADAAYRGLPFTQDKSKTDKLYRATVNGQQEYLNKFEGKDIDNSLKKGLRDNDKRILKAVDALLDSDYTTYGSIVNQIASEGKFDKELVSSAIQSEANYFGGKIEEGAEALRDGNDKAYKDVVRELRDRYKGIYTQDEIIKMIKSYEFETEEETDEEKSIYKTKYIIDALERGDTYAAQEMIDDIISTKIANGKTEEEARQSVRSTLTSYWKPLYQDAFANGDSYEQNDIRNSLYEMGVYGSYEDIADTLHGWKQNYVLETYKPQYIEAYQKGDTATMRRIESKVYSLGVYKNAYKTVRGWVD